MKGTIYETEFAEAKGEFSDDGGRFTFDYWGENPEVRAALIHASNHQVNYSESAEEDDGTTGVTNPTDAPAEVKFAEAQALLARCRWVGRVDVEE
jgi:hypothetical protein